MKLELEFLAITLIIASFWGSAEAVHCYQCTSAYEPGCGETFKSDEVKSYDCNKSSPPRWLLNALGNHRNATGCMKHVRMLNGKANIERSCFYGNLTEKTLGCTQDPSLNVPSIPVSCLVCAGDLCNGASKITTQITSIGAFITTCVVALWKIF